MHYCKEGASHIPILTKILELSKGPVLEMGVGPFSTPILHWLCFDKKRELISYENNPTWFNENKVFETNFHKVIFVKDWDDIEITKTHWGVAFIDHAPNERRKVDIKKLANCADYIVIHDSEECHDEHYLYSEIYPLFKYKYDYTKEKPYTTVLSNFKDLSFLNNKNMENEPKFPETREELAEYFVGLGLKKGAEIGVEQGRFTKVLCEAGLEVYAIDAWQSHRGYRDHVDQKKLDGFLEKTKERLASYNCHIVKGFSMDVVKQFKDESLDFCYIDANHSFKYAAEDIYEWSKKVRKGGIVSGHDYAVAVNKQGLNACHVKYVVDAWVEAKEIELFTTKERTPSWFYIKK